jgi:hypothetical protein
MEYPKPATPRQVQLEGLFKEFVEMGADRSYGKLGRKHGIEGPELLRHSKQFLWPERINSMAIKQNEENAVPDEKPDEGHVNKLHLTRLRLLQQKAMTYLENCTFDKPDTALRMLVDCMKLQREILGLSKDKEDDLRSILLGRLKEAEEAKGPAAPTANDFPFDPDYVPPALPDGSQANSSPPSGGDHAV